MKIDIDKVYEHVKKRKTRYDEEFHCKLLLKVMTNKSKSTMSAFCVEALVGDDTFFRWLKEHELFFDIYSLGKMFAREAWERDGRRIKKMTLPMGTISYEFEYWKMIGWSRFGISKNSRIRLEIDAKANPNEHYAQLLKQAANGDFTAGEIKQLMEAVNVGLNTHQAFALQKEIDQLKSDLAIMTQNTNVQNSFTNKGIAQKD